MGFRHVVYSPFALALLEANRLVVTQSVCLGGAGRLPGWDRAHTGSGRSVEHSVKASAA